MVKRGARQPGGTAAHHVVASTSKKARVARDHLERLGIDINDSVNGIFLPKNKSTPNPGKRSVHSSIHTNRYYNTVSRRVVKARSKAEAKAIIRRIKREAKKGKW